MSWFLLALFSTFVYAIINLIDDHLLSHVYRSPHSGTIVSSLFAGIPLLSLLFLDTKPLETKFILLAVLAGMTFSVFLYNYFRSFEVEAPSVVVTFAGLSPLLLAVLAYFIVDERPAKTQILGAVIVFVASVLLVFNPKERIGSFKKMKSPIFMLLAFTAYSVLIKYIFTGNDFYTAYMWISAGMVMGGVYFALYLLFAHQKETLVELRKSFRKYYLIFIGAEVLALIAEFANSLAVSRGPLTIVKTIENIQPMFVLFIALALYPFRPSLFREAAEGGKTRKFFLMLVIVVGLVLIGESI